MRYWHIRIIGHKQRIRILQFNRISSKKEKLTNKYKTKKKFKMLKFSKFYFALSAALPIWIVAKTAIIVTTTA